jgi:hypothetical protein
VRASFVLAQFSAHILVLFLASFAAHSPTTVRQRPAPPMIQTKSPSPPTLPNSFTQLASQLLEMGFSSSHVNKAITSTGKEENND